MSKLISLVKSDITDKNKQVMLFRIAEHAVQEALQSFAETGKPFKKEQLMKKKEVRSYLCKFIIEQLHKAGYPNSLVIMGKDFNISLKYKKNTLMRFYLPGDYIMMIYESPNISKA